MVATLACVFLVLIFEYYKASFQKELFVALDRSYPVHLVDDHAGVVLRVLLHKKKASFPFGFLRVLLSFLMYDFLDPT